MTRLEPVGKPFDISKTEVWDAYLKVRSNKGAPGVDGKDLDEFETDLKNNLYKIWNRMSSGSYFPPAVRGVEIPKPDGGARLLGVPTVADRIAQTVVADRLTAVVEPVFHDDSYGYRPGRSALDAVAACRKRCWQQQWVVDLDISRFFDSVDHTLLMRAVDKHAPTAWVSLYVRRWLVTPMVMPDGTHVARDRGTPQGSAISPVLANLFLHYAFDDWMHRNFPSIRFERYVDDAVVHCRSLGQATLVKDRIAERFAEVGLVLHPDKTKIVHCPNGQRPGSFPREQFTFLGYTFRPRGARSRSGAMFTGFLPAISDQALKRLSAQVRSWRLHKRTRWTLAGLARWLNPIVRGWMLYYGAFYPSLLHRLLARINAYLLQWMRRKYKRLKSLKKAYQAWGRIMDQYPRLFVHWEWVRGAYW